MFISCSNRSQMRKNQASNEKTLERKARKLRVEPIIKTPESRPKTPKLVQTVMQVREHTC